MPAFAGMTGVVNSSERHPSSFPRKRESRTFQEAVGKLPGIQIDPLLTVGFAGLPAFAYPILGSHECFDSFLRALPARVVAFGIRRVRIRD